MEKEYCISEKVIIQIEERLSSYAYETGGILGVKNGILWVNLLKNYTHIFQIQGKNITIILRIFILYFSTYYTILNVV